MESRWGSGLTYDFIVNASKQKPFSEVGTSNKLDYKDYLELLGGKHNVNISLYLAPVLKELEGQYICVKAHSSDLQDMFWGNSIENINKQRFGNSKVIMDDPHPIA